MKNIYLFICTLLFCACSTSQTTGLVYPNQDQATSSSEILAQNRNASTIENFKITSDLHPITVQVNVIVLKRDTKSQTNFNLDNPEEKALLVDYFNKINEVWSKFYPPQNLTGCYTGKDFYEDSKIRFKFNFIEITDSKAWNYSNSGADLSKNNVSGFSPTENWYLAYMDKKLDQDPTLNKGILVYLTQDGNRFDELYRNKGKGYNLSGVEASQFPSTTNLTRTSAIHVPNRYLKYLAQRYQAPIENKTTWAETRKWHLNDAIGTAHEFGHSLGLAHTNSYHGTNQCQYSLMSQNWQHPRNYLQPTEILKAHQFLRESNLIQFVTEDSFLGNTFLINQNTTWTKTQRFYSNLKVENNITLTIEKPIIISPQASITFGKNAHIFLKGEGKLLYPNGKEFNGFVNKTATSIQ